MLDVISWVLSKKFATDTAIGAGGLKGDKGEEGDSAYEIALKNGFVGTEEEWLESLKMGANELETIVQQEVADQIGTTVEDSVEEQIDNNLATEDLDFSGLF